MHKNHLEKLASQNNFCAYCLQNNYRHDNIKSFDYHNNRSRLYSKRSKRTIIFSPIQENPNQSISKPHADLQPKLCALNTRLSERIPVFHSPNSTLSPIIANCTPWHKHILFRGLQKYHWQKLHFPFRKTVGYSLLILLPSQQDLYSFYRFSWQ